VCATWETLRRHVPEGLNFMATGEPFWNCDVGGFFTSCREPWFWRGEFPRGTEDPGYRELFVRWLQYACFLTMMRAHGTDTPREIWQFGDEGDRYYEAIAACIRMRYRLLAYQYSLMAETREKGIPAVRVPALVFPEDMRLRETDNEMMLGGGILVCPVTRPVETLPGGEKIADPDENTEVYLPAGFRWYEADGNGVYDGGQAVTVRTPLEKVPVFVREGTILPLSPVRQYTDEETAEPVEIIIFPGTDGAFAFYDDDGISYDYEYGEYQRIPMRWNDRERALTLSAQEGRLRREQRFAVRMRGGKETREITYTGEEMTAWF
jgi:alpha-D-xyloside xylohydrolase